MSVNLTRRNAPKGHLLKTINSRRLPPTAVPPSQVPLPDSSPMRVSPDIYAPPLSSGDERQDGSSSNSGSSRLSSPASMSPDESIFPDLSALSGKGMPLAKKNGIGDIPKTDRNGRQRKATVKDSESAKRQPDSMDLSGGSHLQDDFGFIGSQGSKRAKREKIKSYGRNYHTTEVALRRTKPDLTSSNSPSAKGKRGKNAKPTFKDAVKADGLPCVYQPSHRSAGRALLKRMIQPPLHLLRGPSSTQKRSFPPPPKPSHLHLLDSEFPLLFASPPTKTLLPLNGALLANINPATSPSTPPPRPPRPPCPTIARPTPPPHLSHRPHPPHFSTLQKLFPSLFTARQRPLPSVPSAAPLSPPASSPRSTTQSLPRPHSAPSPASATLIDATPLSRFTNRPLTPPSPGPAFRLASD